MMTTALVFVICLAASTIGGICGIGGGVVIKPLLDSIGIMSVSTVSFLSGLTVLAMACLNVLKNRRGCELDTARSVPLGIGAAVGGIAGKQVFSSLKAALNADRMVGAVQAMVLGLLILGTLLYVLNKARISAKNVGGIAAPGFIGLMLGICSSFLGIGGGPMNLAVLYYFFSMDTKKAAVNSILIILLSQLASLIFSLITGVVPAFSWSVLAAMVLAGAAGGLLSAHLHKKLSAHLTDRLFIGLLIVIFAICVYNAVRMLA
ncbi:MAG: sulfite exporter TauE/SafE family protein [Clostridia bacterium]|nr:sulfite exporter TauE/SafE family protein [Clostridia bacterium]